MNKTWIVFKQELTKILTSRSFLLTLILVPLGSLVVFLVMGMLQKQNVAPGIEEIFTEPAPTTEYRGLVDHSGLIKIIPQDYQDTLLVYSDEDSAAQALTARQINGYYVVAADYVDSGAVELVVPDFNPLSSGEQTGMIAYVLKVNLLNDKPEVLLRTYNLMSLDYNVLQAEPQRDPSSMLTFFLPYIVTFLFYMLILSTASMMLSSVAHEKENRVMEVMLTSVTPLNLLTGKIFALGLAGLIQTVVWSSVGLLLLRGGQTTFSIGQEFQLPATILIWGVLFFLLGYTIYASLMAGLGALVPNMREGSQATMIVILPLIIPLIFISSLIDSPNSALSIGLSLFPLTSPVAMMSRLAGGGVPFWQPALAVLLLILTAYFIVQAVARMFRAQNLLSGQTVNAKRYFLALLGK